MLQALLHRGRSFGALTGCTVDRLPSTGNQLCVREFSSMSLGCYSWTKEEWKEVYEGIFERPSVLTVKEHSKTRSTENVPMLPSKLHNPVDYNGERQKALKENLTENNHQSSESEDLRQVRERQKALKGNHTENNRQSSESEDLWQVFRNLVKELNVDHAILLCAQLPSNRLQTGLDTLIRACLEGVYDATYKDKVADKIFDLLKQCKGKRCIPSEVTRHSLIKWLLDSGDAKRAQRFLQLLQMSQYSNSLEAERSKDRKSQDLKREPDILLKKSVPAKAGKIIAEELSRFQNELGEPQNTANTQLMQLFQLLGRSNYQEHLSDSVERYGLKGVSNAGLSKPIDFYAGGCAEETCGSPRGIKRVSQVFQKINNILKLDTNASFNRVIAYSASHGEIAQSIQLIRTMKSIGLQPCAASYEPLIEFFARTFEISKAEDILRMMRNYGLHATKKAYECLIVAYTKSDNLEKAFNLIEEISLEELVPDLYDPLIFAYGSKGNVSYALSIFKQMRLKNVKPSAQNFASLIHACSNRKNIQGAEKVFKLFKKQSCAEEADELVVSAMMKVYAACGNDEQIDKVMSCTYAKNLVAKAALLKGFAEGGKVQKALQMYNQIRNEGYWPDAGTFMSLLSTLSKAGEVDQLLELFDPFKKSIQTKNRVLQENLSSRVCCNIVHALIHHNQLERALDFLEKIQLDNAGDVETLCLKVFTLDKCETKYFEHEHMSLEDKLEFLCAMRDRLKVQPTRLAYESLLESCAREMDFKCADRVMHMMKSDNLVLNVFTYLILLRVIVASESLETLKLFLPKMRRAVKNRGLEDDHVKLLVVHILKGASVDISDMISILYPSAEIRI